ncbi:hypothetical protein DB347_10665 [Opitutaceae bacterium EW11]|nr:hypothetical protein DB347_10665 [Opitutaceae bacterium EW11]
MAGMRFPAAVFVRRAVALLALALPAAAQESSGGFSLPALPPLFEATAAFASSANLPVGVFDAVTDAGVQPGDRAVAVVTLEDKNRQVQWLVEVAIVPTPPEKTKAFQQSKPLVIYSSTGNRLEYSNDCRTVRLTTHGPFAPEPNNAAPPRLRTSEAVVNSDHLLLGLDRACATFIRLHQQSAREPNDPKWGLSYSSSPFSPEALRSMPKLPASLTVSVDDERAFAGSMPALISFFQIAQSTPGVQDALSEVLDLPIWSIIAHAGQVSPYFKMDGDHILRLADGAGHVSRYLLPMDLLLNGKLALRLNVVAVSPRPPYASTAGILEVRAQNPKNPSLRAFIQVLGAQRAASAAAAATNGPSSAGS